MPKWDVYGVVTGTKYLGAYEAETVEQAKEKALGSEAAGVSLCHQCSSECQDPEIHEVCVERADRKGKSDG